MIEVREVLRGWLEGGGLRTVAERAGVDRKAARRYVQAAQEAGLERSAGLVAVDDELVGAVVAAVRPGRPHGHGAAWETLLAHEEQIRAWVAGDGKDAKPLSIVKVEELLARQGVVVPYRTLHRFATARCGYRAKESTVRVDEGEPGVELQVDFGHMGYLTEQDGRRRKVHALILTAVVSRHMFVWLTYSQTLTAVIAGCEAAWTFFGGVFKVLVPDNLKPVVTDADAVNPRLSSADNLFTRLHAARLDNTLEAEMRKLAPRRRPHPRRLRPPPAGRDPDQRLLRARRRTTPPRQHHRDLQPRALEWLTMTSDAPLAQSAVDRLTSGAHTLVIEGPSYRQRHTHRRGAIDTKEQDQ